MAEGRLVAGRYRLADMVGRGGMGVVWRARDETLGRDVAVKEVRVPPGVSPEQQAMQCRRAMREARSAARLSHPGVVTVHDVVEEDGRPWVVMELIHGTSLQEIITRDGRLPADRVAEIGFQVLTALNAAHALGILHRDVKPGNILLADDNRVVLTDFGIAVIEGETAITQTGALVGSPAYMPPERLRGQQVTPSSDLWALGATLYTAVEGCPPFHHKDPAAVYGALLAPEPAPSPRNADLLTPVIEGLLRKEPERRWNTVTAMEHLRALTRSAPTGTAATNAQANHRAVRRPAAPDTGPRPAGSGDEAATGSTRFHARFATVSCCLAAVLMVLEMPLGLRVADSLTLHMPLPHVLAYLQTLLIALAGTSQVPSVVTLGRVQPGRGRVLSRIVLVTGVAGSAALVAYANSLGRVLSTASQFQLELQTLLWTFAWLWLVPAGLLLWSRSKPVAAAAWTACLVLELAGVYSMLILDRTVMSATAGVIVTVAGSYAVWALLLARTLRPGAGARRRRRAAADPGVLHTVSP